MDSERGGPITGFLIGIGAIVVFFGLLAVACGACTSNGKDNNHSLGRVQLIAYHNDCRDDGYCGDGNGEAGDDRGDCDWNGNCGGNRYRNEYGRGKNGDQGRAGRDQCHSFCNNVIVVPDPTQKKEPPPDQQPQSIACSSEPVPVPGEAPQQHCSHRSPPASVPSLLRVLRWGSPANMPRSNADLPVARMEDLECAATSCWSRGPRVAEPFQHKMSGHSIPSQTLIPHVSVAGALLAEWPVAAESVVVLTQQVVDPERRCTVHRPAREWRPMSSPPDVVGVAHPPRSRSSIASRHGTHDRNILHCDQKPSGFIPPNPGKIPQQVADFVKVVSDFVQSVIKFAV